MASQPALHAKQPIYLRCEMKPHEHRAALTPTTAKTLIEHGWDVTVERDPQRIFADEEYEKVGCKLSPHNTWDQVPPHIPIIGLKELPAPGPPLPHTHIQFAHCFKKQAGWVDVLSRFRQGGGKLYDLEFLEDANGRRVAAFGWHAGFAGAALGLLALAEQLESGGQKRLGKQVRYPNEGELVKYARERIEVIRKHKKDGKVKALVVGALGRCGRGAIDFFEKAGLASDDIVRWDMQETAAKSGPYQEMLDVDIFLNAIYLNTKIPAFLTKDFIESAGAERRLGVVVDVSCDTTNPNNPLPIYDINTTFDEPTVDVPLSGADAAQNPLTVVSIDHLPTLLPREASEGFSSDLLPSLLQLPYVTGVAAAGKVAESHVEGKGAVWKRAEDLFRKHLAEAEKEGA
ncbi:Formate/glycerate dehydrogenase catalytic domain-like protein [Tilletiaria anomala UBC 951]|uniref:Saccharopine dehydrogenase [NAD(+), L-lysine-forming] n=1 Tax=Tilletiaria anomala (strain ATCC 24038 / CBS 436.72 / UBC 951) TaxID=1037660 RepID=A0A066VDX3_TILAU|nr:Formate/glycerate dehydrogenase catalytic domain-like protein [Tilletiaria anomala UBC 951]KDN39922.1 Formate/glycerate dehydrogenase catalytic domain-like protein [Tilletiaria anomala UBC 951]